MGLTFSYYAGIGSRKTPPSICESMTQYASWLRGGGLALRSGHARGADQAFEKGAGPSAEIYLPWNGFEDKAPILGKKMVSGDRKDLDHYVDRLHPQAKFLTRGERALMRRNTCQILGNEPGYSPISLFVLCWTEGGRVAGGTGQALRIAETYGVPIFNLHDKKMDELLVEFLRNLPFS